MLELDRICPDSGDDVLDPDTGKRLFICHSHDDAEVVRADTAWLENQGFEPWIDQRIGAGSDWADALAQAIDGCRALLFFASPASVVSAHCLNEIAYAVDAGKPIFVIFLSAVELTGGIKLFVARTQAIARWHLAVDEYRQQLRDALRGTAREQPAKTVRSGVRLWQVPLRRNQGFSGREPLLMALRQRLQSSPDPAVLVLAGLPGIGKSQTALEFAYRHADDFRVVAWLRAESTANLNTDFVNLARGLGLPAADGADTAAVIDAVLKWLTDHASWLLVFDNVDDPKLLASYLPGQFRGKVIVTSRRQNWGNWVQRVAMEGFMLDEAVDFVVARGPHADQAAARDLATALGCLPLALEEAVAYMEATGRSITSYLALFNEHHDVLLARAPVASDYPNTLRTAFEVSLLQLEVEDVSAARLLQMLSFVAADDIPHDLTESLMAALDVPQPKAVVVDECLAALRKFSLINVHDNEVSAHRLVQLVSRDRMSDADRAQTIPKVLRTMESLFPQVRDMQAAAANCMRLLPHAVAVLNHARDLPTVANNAGSLWGRTGTFLSARNASEEGQRHLQQAYAIFKDNPDHLRMFARTAELYGRILYYNGHLIQAVVVHEEALAAYRSTEGDGSLRVMQIHVDLAWFSWTSGDFDAGLAACTQALDVLEGAAGANDPRAMAATSIQARLQMECGRIAQSQRTVESTIRAIEQLQGLRTPLMCGVFLQVAHVLLNLGFPLRAKSWAQESLMLGKEIFSDHHALMAASRCVLGQSLVAIGELESARAMFAATAETLRRTRPPLNQHVCIAPYLLADVLIAAGEIDEARRVAEEAADILATRVSGDATLVRAQHVLTRARLAAHDGEAKQAMALAVESDRMIARQYGETHPYRLPFLLVVGRLTFDEGRLDAARRCHELALDLGRTHDLNLHPTIAEHLLALAQIAEQRGDHEMTTVLKRDALEVCRQRLGPTSKAVLAID